MMKTIQISLFLLFCLFVQTVSSQYLVNPSLEGNAGTDDHPDGWVADDIWANPDIDAEHYTPADLDLVTPAHGNTFARFRARGINHTGNYPPLTLEYLYQQLENPLEAYHCFNFEIYLATNSDYDAVDSEDPGVGYPVVLQIWGGNEPNPDEILLYESDTVMNEKWELHEFQINTENQSLSYIKIQVNWDTVNVKDEPYNGQMFMDNLSLEKIGSIDTNRMDTVHFLGDGKTSLLASDGDYYKWQPEDFLSPNNQQSTIITAYHDEFNVLIGKENECPVIEKFYVIFDCNFIYPDSVNNTQEKYYKYFENVQLEASDGDNYQWSPQVNLSAYDVQSPVMTDFHDYYEVRITDKYDCGTTEQFYITIDCDSLVGDYSYLVLDTSIQDQMSFQLTPRYGRVNSLWSPDHEMSCIDCQSPVVNPVASTEYRVELVDEYGCLHEERFNIELELTIPNVITPNNDGFNDCFKILGLPPGTNLLIYDKNGALVYESEPYSYDDCWIGEDNNGKKLRSDTYWYVLTNDQFGFEDQGFILIVR